MLDIVRKMLSVLLLFGFLSPGVLFAQTSERIFPETTLGFFAVSSVKGVTEQWRECQLGKMLQDPKMQPFKDDLEKQIKTKLTDSLGLSFDEIRELPSGEISGGLVVDPDRRVPGYVLLLDVKGNEAKTFEFIEKRADQLVAAGHAKKSKLKIGGLDTLLLTFVSKDITDQQERKTYFLISKNYLIISPNPTICDLMIKRTNGPVEKSLAGKKTFIETMSRCTNDRPDASIPVIRWYIEPLPYGEAARVIAGVSRQKRTKSIFTILAEQGFDAIRGVGGTVDLKEGEKESVHRTFVYAPKPYRAGMRMVALNNSIDYDFPAWMPDETAGCSIFHLEPLQIFDNFGCMFDAFAGGGETGLWDDIVKNLKDAHDGPKIDIRKELIENFDSVVYGATVIKLPIGTDSERMIIGIRLKKGSSKVVDNALVKLFGKDIGAEKFIITGADGETISLWETVEPEVEVRPDISVSGIPDLDLYGDDDEEEYDEEEEIEPFFPNGGFAVAYDYLFFSNNVEYLKELLGNYAALKQKATVRNMDSHQRMIDAFKAAETGETPRFYQRFARTDTTARATFETLRQGYMPQSESILGKLVNAIFFPEEPEHGTTRKPLIDGSLMPSFEELKHYFGDAGSFGTVQEDGWFIKGFSLPPEN